ncbi:MAG: thioredoxin fold domain-containing protein [Magnetococcales bacterium]|nr:thioredoxin fold domain-containing protein [Magnetococcales bacterium]
MKKRGRLTLLLLSLLLFSNTAQAETIGRLIVFTSAYCPYCEAFMRDVGGVYGKTTVGKHFPMTQVDSHDPPKAFEELSWTIRFFPTFLVLDKEGKRLALFRGYRGEEFFWGDMERLMNKTVEQE